MTVWVAFNSGSLVGVFSNKQKAHATKGKTHVLETIVDFPGVRDITVTYGYDDALRYFFYQAVHISGAKAVGQTVAEAIRNCQGQVKGGI